MKKLKYTEAKDDPKLLRLDLGTGKGLKKPEGFIGVDKIGHKGVDLVLDLAKRWPWKANSVDEVNADYLLQYLTAAERVHFANELYRVLKPGAKAVIIVPHWCASKAYLDTGAHWPPVSEAWFHPLNKEWRESQNYVDTSGYTCDFEANPPVGYGLHPMIVTRNQEYQQQAVAFWKEAAQDIAATLVKK